MLSCCATKNCSIYKLPKCKRKLPASSNSSHLAGAPEIGRSGLQCRISLSRGPARNSHFHTRIPRMLYWSNYGSVAQQHCWTQRAVWHGRPSLWQSKLWNIHHSLVTLPQSLTPQTLDLAPRFLIKRKNTNVTILIFPEQRTTKNIKI